MSRRELWIGLAEVARMPGSDLFADPYAFVPVVGYAAASKEFFNLVKEELHLRQFRLIRLEDIELLYKRRQKHTFAPEFEREIETVGEDIRLALGNFHTLGD